MPATGPRLRPLLRLAPALPLLLLAGCSLFYGPTTSESGFVSARLARDGRTVAFTYQRLVYEPARGLAAFPGGGTPRYREDHALFGTCEAVGGNVRILISEKNREFEPGQGRMHIVDMTEPKVLLSRAGELRGGKGFTVRHLLADTRTGRVIPLDLQRMFAERGRVPGVIRMIDPDGTLLFESPTLAEAASDPAWTRNPSVIPELWARTPDGRLRRLAATRHFAAALRGEVFYWDVHAREHVAVDIESGAARPAPEFRAPEPEPVEHGVTIADHRRTLLYGRRDDDAWRYREVPVRSQLLQ